MSFLVESNVAAVLRYSESPVIKVRSGGPTGPPMRKEKGAPRDIFGCIGVLLLLLLLQVQHLLLFLKYSVMGDEEGAMRDRVFVAVVRPSQAERPTE